jgi:2-aminoadipate transaminase
MGTQQTTPQGSAFDATALFAERVATIPSSFIRDILKVTARPEVISFAGGLPNPAFFPVEAIHKATDSAMTKSGKAMLQYSTTEGFLPLREWISERYKSQQGLDISPDDILITNGSQQSIDLVGKIFLDKGDRVVLENPGYLGAIQSFSAYQPAFVTVELNEDGIDTVALEQAVLNTKPKLVSTIPNFQNPTGISYSLEIRERVGDVLKSKNVVVIEDDPYGDLKFVNHRLPSLKHYLGNQLIQFGSFSKIVAPGLRLGWVAAHRSIIDKLNVAKQAADLHSNFFAQRVMFEYLSTNNIDTHIATICQAYKYQRDVMISAIGESLPSGLHHTMPEGGMFIWLTLPEGASSVKLLELALRRNVAFVPGKPFFANGGGENTMRLNFSNSDEQTIREGMRRLGEAVAELLQHHTVSVAV